MKSSDYWKERFALLEQSQHQQGIQCYADIERQYRRAQKQIEGQIAAWYQRFAANNEISITEAHSMLNRRELEELKWDVNDYIKYGKENAVNGLWIKQLENASAKYHISRLEAIKLQMQQSLEVMFGNQLDSIDRTMRSVYKNGFYRTAFEIQKGVGVGWDFGTLDEKQIGKVINRPWAADGKNFSERVWGSRQKLVNELNQTLTQNIILGQDPKKAIDAIARKMNVSKNAAGKLVMTEEAFFSSAAQKDCFAELDVEQFEIVAVLDSHTSEICQEMDGKVFPVSQWEVGVTAPPFHVWCRTTTVPAYGDEFDRIGKRAARGEDGKTYYVPASMTYKEWRKSFVEGDKTGLQEVRSDDIIKSKEILAESVEDTQTFAEMQIYMKDNHGMIVDDSVGLLDFQSVREGVQGVEYIIKEFPKARSSFRTIGTKKNGLMCAGYDGGINFNPVYYKTRKTALWNHGIGEGISQGDFHPKGNNCFGSGAHESGHILEKALIDKVSSESVIGQISWNNCTYAKALVSDACKNAKKLPECKGMLNSQLKGAISCYAKTNDSECLAEAVCDVALNGEDAAPLSKEIWKLLKRELG